MTKFITHKIKNKRKIVSFSDDNIGFLFTPNIKRKNMIKINELYLCNSFYTDILVTKKIDKEIKRLTLIAASVINDDDTTEGDVIIALNEVTRIKKMIFKYKEYIKEKEYELDLKRLKLF